MPMTEYTGDTDIIAGLGTTPQERGLTADQFKAKFDQFGTEFIAWFNGTHLPELSTLLNFKVLTFTRDMSLATGTQSIAGAGGTPKAVIFLAANNAAANQDSIGFDTQTAKGCKLNNSNATPSTQFVDITTSIYILHNASTAYSGYISTMNADGFTIQWTKTGSATGTVTVVALALL